MNAIHIVVTQYVVWDSERFQSARGRFRSFSSPHTIAC